MGKLREKWSNLPIAVKVSVAYAICSIFQKCLAFFTLPLFTRLLTTEQYGQLTIYQSWQGIMSIFLTLNLAYGSFSTAMIRFEDDRDGYISAVEGICFVLSGLFLLIYLPLQNVLNKLFELPSLFICVMVIEMLGTSAIQFWSGKKRFEFKYKCVVAVTLSISVGSPLLTYVLIMGTAEKGYARILGYALVNIFVGCIFFFTNAIRGKKFYDKEYWKYALGFNVPLLAYYFSQIIFNQSDRIMISHMVGTDKAAIYGVAYQLAMVLTFMLNAINSSYVPWFYEKIKEGKQGYNKQVSFGIAIIMAMLLSVIIIFAPEIILIMAGEKYMEAVYVIPPIATSLLLLFYTQLFANVEFYYEEKKKLVCASIGAAIVNFILNLIFIHIFGFVAAAYTTLVSYVIFALSNYYAMKRVLVERNIDDKWYSYKYLILLFMGLCGVGALAIVTYTFLILRIVIVFLISILFFLKRAYFAGLYKTIKNS